MKLLGALVLVCTVSAAQAAGAHGKDWFPHEGKLKMHQECIDALHPTVAMMISFEPGSEDLALLANLRLWQGARTIVVHATNGEATASDTLGRYPQAAVGLRKEEADRVATRLGAEAWFMNMRDLGAVQSAQSMEREWPLDSAVCQLVMAIRTFRPDVIILCHDWHAGEPRGARDSVMMKAVTLSIQRAATVADTSMKLSLLPWIVPRVVVGIAETRAKKASPTGKHPIWHLTNDEIASDVASEYRTLRSSIAQWQGAARTYHVMDRNGADGPPVFAKSMVALIPEIPRVLMGVSGAIERAILPARTGGFKTTVAGVVTAIDSVEHVLAVSGQRLSTPERRILGHWKNTLEDLRCTMLGIGVVATPSDSLITNSQVWSLHLASVTPKISGGATQIMFPLVMQGEWSVIEGQKYYFPVTPPQDFRILTGTDVPFDYPSSSFGLLAHSMKFKFPYYVYHKDPNRMLNFVYRGEVVFHVGPRRSFEALTSLIAARPGVPVISSMRNISRDPFKGRLVLHDTSSLSTETSVVMTMKDQLVVDTLFLPYTSVPPAGEYPWILEIPSRAPTRMVLTARSIPCSIDSTLSIGILTSSSDSPVQAALELSQKNVRVVRNTVDLSAITVLVLDRGAMLKGSTADTLFGRVREWTEDGGHLVVLPQDGIGAMTIGESFGTTFRQCRPIPPDEAVGQRTSEMWESPKGVSEEAWRGWVEARAYYAVDMPADHPVATAELTRGTSVLVASFPFGKGKVTLVALDLWSQLANLHPGSFQILSNLVAFGRHGG